MIAQHWKDLWYVAWAPLLEVNRYRYRIFNGHAKANLKLNIGCGKSQFAGWLNLDGNVMHRPDMWLDVRRGLPFRERSVDAIYACHFFEHFYLRELNPVLAECRRILREGGCLRIAVPNLGSAIAAYQSGDPKWFSTFPAEFRSLGGRFFNEMLCGDQHRLMFDFSFLSEILTEAGFKRVTELRRGESEFLASEDPALQKELASSDGKEPDPWLIVEATA
jgi:predicted SAM-dependent methyltransferase